MSDERLQRAKQIGQEIADGESIWRKMGKSIVEGLVSNKGPDPEVITALDENKLGQNLYLGLFYSLTKGTKIVTIIKLAEIVLAIISGGGLAALLLI